MREIRCPFGSNPPESQCSVFEFQVFETLSETKRIHLGLLLDGGVCHFLMEWDCKLLQQYVRAPPPLPYPQQLRECWLFYRLHVRHASFLLTLQTNYAIFFFEGQTDSDHAWHWDGN